MQKILILLIIMIATLSSCKTQTIILSGEIIEVNYDSNAVLINEYDLNGLVWVGFEDEFKFSFGTSDELIVGNEVDIKAKPEIVESYPMSGFGIKIIKNQPKEQ